MPLEEAIRRNRRRIAVIVTTSLLNYWVLVTVLAVIWLSYLTAEAEKTVSAGTMFAVSGGLGAVVALTVVSANLGGVRPRAMAQLRAVEITPGEFARVENLLQGLAIAAGTPPVSAALLADEAPNALAVGRRPSDTTIVVTSGLIEKLSRDELEAVLAAEMCAIRRLDAAMESVVMGTTASAVAIHSYLREDWKDPRSWFLIAATWPSMAVAELIRRSVLRSCDFGADDMALTLTRHPEALRRALQKLDDDKHVVDPAPGATRPLWFEPIPDDSSGRMREFRNIRFAPSLSERIARLPHVEDPSRITP